MGNIKLTLNPAYDRVSAFVSNLHAIFEDEGTVIYDKRNKVKLFEIGGDTYVVKKYKRPMLHQRIDYTFIRQSKARRAYNYALRFRSLGIDTPDAVACVEVYKFGLFSVGYFVSTYCNDPDLRILREEPKDDLIEAFAHFVLSMHEKGIMHGDLNLSNILYRPDAESMKGYHFTVIDTNRSHFLKTPSKRQCLRNMVRISHVRPLNEQIVNYYAEMRGWNKEECYAAFVRMLDVFENRRRLKRKVKIKKK